MGFGKVKDQGDGDSRTNGSRFSAADCSIELTSTYNNSEASVEVNVCDCDGPEQDCLHNAAKHGAHEEIKYLLEKGADANCVDKLGRTALHWIVALDCICESCMDNAEECVKYFLFTSRTNIDARDGNGDTPLDLAIDSKNIKCANMLVSLGANVAMSNGKGKSTLHRMAKKTPEVLVSVMDKAISIQQLNPNNEKCVVQLDFRSVIGYPPEEECEKPDDKTAHLKPEMSLFSRLLNTKVESQKVILAHPLAAIFLNEKWRRVRKYFVLFFAFYLFWLISYTSYIIKVYLISCPCDYFAAKKPDIIPEPIFGRALNRNETSKEDRCHLETGLTFDVIFIIFLTLVMALTEVTKIVVSPHLYFKTKLSFANWILIVTVIITTGPVLMEPNTKPDAWQYEAAAVAVFLSWAFLLSQLGTFQCLGRYIEILGHVLKNFALTMLTFSTLLVAFALSFNVLFPGEDEAFSHFPYAMLKVLVMMTGEVDYQDMFYDKENDSTRGPIVGHVLYAVFVIVIAIVLMNLLIGLTVSDIQTLQKEAEFSQRSSQIVNIIRLESFLFSKKLKSKLLDCFRRSISVRGTPSGKVKGRDPTDDRSMFRFKPNDRKDRSATETLKADVLKIAVKNYHSSSAGLATSKSSSRSLRSKNTISLTSE